MRIGVLGGSFNPPHVGHLIIASDAFEALRLDRLYVVPAHANPLKGLDDSGPSPDQRLEMVRLVFGRDPRFEVSDVEIRRGGLSFTVDTLGILNGQNPGAELILLLGLDSAKSLPRWKDPERVRELASIAVLSRGDDAEGLDGVEVVTTRRVDVSSTEVRERLYQGLPVTGFVAESVEAYISAAKLYRPRAG